ncbi:receptor-type tyrosine-protein phosphatase eta-like isoform X2 [Narcine bancroftii]|uniref:receptor-type tyrosine-protein phosphatase eta-like isoform X2 n=1 Tax=Narcine bancroftii TaxID=1343680 RepID=UPI003831862C
MAPSWWRAPWLLGSVFLLQDIITSESVPKPGEIEVNSVTNNSISLSWGQPIGINDTQYKFNITYSSDEINSIIEAENSTMLTNLLSGTNYTVMVATHSVNRINSDPVVKNIFTKPNPVSSVTVSNHTTTSVTLSWDRPFKHKPEYTYKVTVSENIPGMITAQESITVTQLSPGTGYSFSVFTLAADNTSADHVNVSSTTVPSKPATITVTAFSNSSISLSLGRPVDMTVTQYNFSITYAAANGPERFLIESTNSITIQDLQSGTNYTIVVTTVVHGGLKSQAVVLNQFTKPNPVRNIAVLTRNTTSITLNWDKPISYKPEYTYNVTVSGNFPVMLTAQQSITVTQLSPGTGYTFSVFTLAADNTSADPVNFYSTTVPSNPTTIAVTDFSNSSISLSLGRPVDMNIAQYNFSITYAAANGPELSLNESTNSTTIQDLLSGTNYTIAVMTVLDSGLTSDAVFLNQFTKPNPVRNIAVLTRNTTSITLNWDKPISYKPEYTYNVTVSGNFPVMLTAQQSITVTQLSPGTGYTFSVFTLAADNTSADPVNFYSTTVPSNPTTIAVTDFSNSSISLSLGRPVDMNIAQYNFSITYAAANGPELSLNESTNSTTIQDLLSGTNYTIAVMTVLDSGLTSDAVFLNQFTKPNPVRNIAVLTRNTTSITLNWDKPISYKPEYTYNVTVSGNFPVMLTAQQSITVTQLSPGTGYTFSVFTLAADNTSADPVNFYSTTVPSNPTTIAVTDFSNSSISLSLGRPVDMNIAQYNFSITYAAANGPELSLNESTNSTTIQDLLSGTNYTIAVTTVLDSGLKSDAVFLNQFTIPSKPATIAVTDFSNSSITLSLGRPVDMNIAQYNFSITYTAANGPKLSLIESTNSTTIQDLLSGTNYTIVVTTVVDGGLKSDAVFLNQFTKPNKVQNVNVKVSSTNFIILRWTQPMDYKEGYQYMILTEGNPAPTGNNGNITVRVENATIEGLTSGTDYSFSVTTLVADGTRADSVQISSYTKPEQIPKANISVSNNGTLDMLFVIWTSPPGNIEMYFVTLQDVKNSDMRINRTNATSVSFNNLRPGRVYNVTVTTSSGPFNITSGNVQGITVPSLPGMIKVLNFSTSFISFEWGAPADMDDGSYSFNITYSNNSNTEFFVQDLNVTTISNLASGTEYTISVATIGPGHLESGIKSIKFFTQPNPVQNLEIVNISTSSISLQWAKPVEYKNKYRYRVVTNGNPPPRDDNGNKTTATEALTVQGLTPGTIYTFYVITLAMDDTQAESINIANYTEPLKIPLENISLSNENTTNSLKVSWIRPPGGVQNFIVSRNDSETYNIMITVPPSETTFVFYDLRPGRLYSVTVTTISGPHHISSDEVFKATFPSPPGNIVVTNVTNSSLEFSWGRPEDMDVEDYKFIVAYEISETKNRNYISVAENKSTVTNLNSGTNYTIIVLTIISQKLNSSFVTKSIFTRPNPVNNLRVVEKKTTSISLSWDQPLGYQNEYRYRVQTSGNISSNETVSGENVLVQGLNSGDSFRFTIFTQAADGTEGTSVSLIQCTNASAVSSLSCEGVNLSPILILKWMCPRGRSQSFCVQAEQNSVIVVTKTAPQCSSGQMYQFNLTSVEFFTNYDVNITTLSCGLPSTPTFTTCKTGISSPPSPPTKLDLPNLEITHNRVKFDVRKEAFNSTNGPIVAIAVIVTKDQNNPAPNAESLETAFSPDVTTYVAEVIQFQSSQNTRASAPEDPISVSIGSNTKYLDYLNHELTPLTDYRFSLAGFTQMNINKSKIDSKASFFVIYDYSQRVTMQQDPAVIIGAVVGTILGALVIIVLVLLLFWWKKRTKSNKKDLTQFPISNLRVVRK